VKCFVLIAGRIVTAPPSHDHCGYANYGDKQEKADNYKCFKDPTHRRAPVYTLSRVLKRIRNANCKINQRSVGERRVYSLLDFSEKLLRSWSSGAFRLIRNFVHIVRALSDTSCWQSMSGYALGQAQM
jgi:hypothetical protein